MLRFSYLVTIFAAAVALNGCTKSGENKPVEPPPATSSEATPAAVAAPTDASGAATATGAGTTAPAAPAAGTDPVTPPNGAIGVQASPTPAH